jgi:DNA-directed RNA polymerase specialized sigma24 family protein
MSSPYNDGFGDALSPEEAERLDRLNRIRVGERVGSHADADDVLQEARIATWRALPRAATKDNPRAWLSVITFMRIIEILDRETWTGHTRVRGQPVDPLRAAGKRSLDDPAFTLAEDLDGPSWVDSALFSYHEGEIARAISELSPRQRQYVYLRFWCGYGHMEIKGEFGMSDSTWDGAKVHLRQSLAHLAAV